MNPFQEMVMDFHEAMNIPIGKSIAISRGELRCRLIEEEAAETVNAIRAGDMVGAIDGLCDLIYVAIGAAVEFGIDLQPFFEAVHESNMAKSGAPVRSDGKILKPDGWQPPKIKEILDAVVSPMLWAE